MKLTSDRVREVIDYCRKHNLGYESASNYRSAQVMAIKGGLRTPNGMLYHFPKLTPVLQRVYLLWTGQTIDELEESCAFMVMQGKVDIIVLRSKKVSKAAQEIENAIP